MSERKIDIPTALKMRKAGKTYREIGDYFEVNASSAYMTLKCHADPKFRERRNERQRNWVEVCKRRAERAALPKVALLPKKTKKKPAPAVAPKSLGGGKPKAAPAKKKVAKSKKTK